MRAEPDGYTLLANSLADTQNLHYIPVPYSAINDFAMIGMIVEGPPLVLIIDAKLPYRSLAELIADARANPKKVSFGTSGPATSPAISLTQLNALAKTEIVGVPYRGSGEAARSVAGGSIQGAFAFYSQAKPLADDGKVRALAVASPQRIATWPDVPTMAELEYANFDHRGFVGLAAPAKTPAPIIALLNKHLNEVVQSEAFKKRMEALGMTVPADNTPEKFAAFMQVQTARQAAFAKLSGHAPLGSQR
jgi:tripartite-type tricarboxylate transporter receptor subunit TctC